MWSWYGKRLLATPSPLRALAKCKYKGSDRTLVKDIGSLTTTFLCLNGVAIKAAVTSAPANVRSHKPAKPISNRRASNDGVGLDIPKVRALSPVRVSLITILALVTPPPLSTVAVTQRHGITRQVVVKPAAAMCRLTWPLTPDQSSRTSTLVLVAAHRLAHCVSLRCHLVTCSIVISSMLPPSLLPS